MREHQSSCTVWDWIAGDRTLNNAKPCSCGFRAFISQTRADILAQHRPLRPLGMSEADWLRTLGITPEDDVLNRPPVGPYFLPGCEG